MNNKKTITSALIILIIFITGWFFVSKLKDLRSPQKADFSANNDLKNKGDAAEGATTPVVTITEGIVEKSSETSVTLKNDKGEATIEITPDYSVYVMDGSAPVLTAPAELKKGAKVKVRHASPGANIISSDSALGTVISANESQIVYKTETGNKSVDITSKPTIYIDNGGSQIIKQASDIKPGAIIAVGYFDDVSQEKAVVIRIDKL